MHIHIILVLVWLTCYIYGEPYHGTEVALTFIKVLKSPHEFNIPFDANANMVDKFITYIDAVVDPEDVKKLKITRSTFGNLKPSLSNKKILSRLLDQVIDTNLKHVIPSVCKGINAASWPNALKWIGKLPAGEHLSLFKRLSNHAYLQRLKTYKTGLAHISYGDMHDFLKQLSPSDLVKPGLERTTKAFNAKFPNARHRTYTKQLVPVPIKSFMNHEELIHLHSQHANIHRSSMTGKVKLRTLLPHNIC